EVAALDVPHAGQLAERVRDRGAERSGLLVAVEEVDAGRGLVLLVVGPDLPLHAGRLRDALGRGDQVLHLVVVVLAALTRVVHLQEFDGGSNLKVRAPPTSDAIPSESCVATSGLSTTSSPPRRMRRSARQLFNTCAR